MCLNVTELDRQRRVRAGTSRRPSRSITKLFNFAAIDSWTNCYRQYMHDGELDVPAGVSTASSIGVLSDGFTWEESPLRCLHVCFLRRSSLDPPDAAGHGRLSPIELGGKRRSRLGTLTRPAAPRSASVAVEGREVPPGRARHEGRRAVLPMTSVSVIVATYEWPEALDARAVRALRAERLGLRGRRRRRWLRAGDGGTQSSAGAPTFGERLAPRPPGRRRLPARPRQEPRRAGCDVASSWS